MVIEMTISESLSGLFKVLGYIAFAVFGLWGVIIDFQIVSLVFGSQAAFISLIILPITFLVVPLYALLEWGYWFPLLIGYGGMVVVMVFSHISDWIKRR